MGHRALIAYLRDDGLFDLRYSHWAAADLKLRNEISEETPLGGDYSEPAFVNALVASLSNAADDEQTDITDIGGEATTPNEPTDVEAEPIEVGVTMHEIVNDHLDYLHHEAFYVVDRDWDVTAFRTLWFGMKYEVDQPADPDARRDHNEDALEGDHGTVGNGAIVTVRWYNDEPVGDGTTKGRYRQLKSTVADMIDRGFFGVEEGQQYMARTVLDDIAQGHNSHEKQGELYFTDQYDFALFTVPPGPGFGSQ